VKDDPDPGDDIFEADISDFQVVRGKDSLKRLGYEKYPAVAFLFTKEFRKRSDSLLQIPSTSQLDEKDEIWFLYNIKYTGPVIDYYYSGFKKSEGWIRNGKMTGIYKTFYQNGKLKSESHYIDGTENGESKEYYKDGSILKKGVLAYGKEQGVWEFYYPNGQLKERSWYRNGHDKDTSTIYYSNGKIKLKTVLKNGKTDLDPLAIKKFTLLFKSIESDVNGEKKAAMKYCSKAIELDPDFADAYYMRGKLKFADSQYDEAIADYDKALQLEPFMAEALADRALARINRFRFGDAKTIMKNRDVTVVTSRDKTSMPADEKEKVCNDLLKAIFLGDTSKKTFEGLTDFCDPKAVRQ
jgi:antitoxin component YwqK of YwqJK toxin-antitoxin module